MSTATNFDPDAIAEALSGTWSFAVIEKPSGLALLHFAESGRSVQFVFDPERPARRIPMRLWYSVESPTHLRFRHKPEHEGWLRGYRFDGDSMILSAEDRSWVCTRSAPEDIPEWFQSELAAELARL